MVGMAGKKQTPLHLVFLRVLAVFVLLDAVLVIGYYPYSTDSLKEDPAETRAQIENFYGTVYAKPESGKQNSAYVDLALENVGKGVKLALADYVKQYQLQDKKVLEVGAGSGQLQDLVADYTALDIAPEAKRYFHKPFVAASATGMPFPDGQFDTVWTFFTLEHIPHPEMALREMRRVLRPDGLLILAPAWNCSEFAARGYRVRPFGDFDTTGKVVKLWSHLASTSYVETMFRFPHRLIRAAQTKISGRETPLHFRKLKANFGTYWEPDADAFVSLDMYEAYLWFKSRGDECLNCESILTDPDHPLIIRVKKPAGASANRASRF